ncbi:twitching motility protein [Desulfofarcimen acetoxidans DSM 771]|uniref:Twitching motility protein n=1 Tax=Desulfofarcimen acetoxidans (strain ATCC 49208 / DSM 771 / KCTC 5769 / VKM B-1644 / 5575) TaxID=485916 RepID=C8W152_DESAS|nr:type IV pilus twitching motility protein PilT [Desulfofarcimen acetoxidans]ACV63448.1 twitching motility protein [Desulfofarcimen acetoxidans DSM 771]
MMSQPFVEGTGSESVFHVNQLLKDSKERDASDLHLTSNTPPVLRMSGGLKVLDNYRPLTPEDIKRLVYQVLSPRQVEVLEQKLSVDLAIGFAGIGRFRVNAYFQRGAITCVMRRLADDIPLLENLGLPESVYALCDLPNGLVLVTGATGSGKSTTLAAVIDRINEKYRHNIITIEDPIEYIYFNRQSIINQRELHTDVESFADALRSSLRSDPDVILVGEMRDLETIRTAIMAAETGHLVFSTLHSRDAVSSVSRMIGVFPPEEQAQIRQQLSVSLKAVISQQLLSCAGGKGRALAAEVMVVTPAISNLIRLGKQEHIHMALDTGTKLGMQTMEQSLEKLARAGAIDHFTALKAARNPSLLKEKLEHK